MKIIVEGIEPQFKIYKMEENVNNKVYIGSTSYPIKHRMSQHKQATNKVDSYFSDIGWDNVSVSIVDTANDKVEMKKKENEHIQLYKSMDQDKLLNKNKAYTGMSRNEYARYSYANKKEYYKNYFARRITCPVCNACFQKSGVSHHNKTKKHKRFLNNENNENT